MTQPTSAAHLELDPASRRDRLIGLIIVAVTFCFALGLSWWAKVQSRPESSPLPGPPTTEGLIGYPSSVDPVQALTVARTLTKRSMLRGFSAEGVNSDGTVDLSEGPGRVRYAFQSAPGEGPQPPRPPGTLARRLYCGKQNVHLVTEGLVADPDDADYPCPPRHADALPEPRCGPRDVWKYAIGKGAPSKRLARVEYYRAKVGPAWRFELPGTPHRFSLYGDCERKLTPAEAVGSVK
jgi:hypothetical protein